MSKLPYSAEQTPEQVWPWWQALVKTGRLSLRGTNYARLSRHVLNLRTSLVTQPRASRAVVPQSLPEASASINLLPRVSYRTLSLLGLLRGTATRRPAVTQLAIFSLLELVATPADIVWLHVVRTFLRLYVELAAIGAEVVSDLAELRRVIVWVLRPLTQSSLFSSRARPWLALGPALSFALVALVLILPLKTLATLSWLNGQRTNLVETAISGGTQLQQAGTKLEQGDLAGAQLEFQQARAQFTRAAQLIDELPPVFSNLVALAATGHTDSLQSAQAISQASGEVAAAGAVATQAWAGLATDVTQVGGSDLRQPLDTLAAAVQNMAPHLTAALGLISTLDSASLPPAARDGLALIQDHLHTLTDLTAQVSSLPAFLRAALVSDTPRLYVVLFQNSNELRPTGGFAGSLALVELKDGKVSHVDIPGGGPYDFQGQLSKLVLPPEPLRLVRGTWQLQDANWFFDFPTSAKKVDWFIEQAGGPHADGVVALNSDVVVQLLKLTGPLSLPAYGKVITADNFMRETQAAVELEYDRTENRPKQFVADLAPLLLEHVLQLPPADFGQAAAVMASALASRNVQVYLDDPVLQQRVTELGWAGEVLTPNTDYLAVVRTNIGGGKTDGVIQEHLTHEVATETNGSLVDTVTLTRTHTGDRLDTFESRRNLDYLRFYVPLGSQLIAAKGFTPPNPDYFLQVPPGAEVDADLVAAEHEVTASAVDGTRITEEFGHTVFGNWVAVSPGETATVQLSYRLPFQLTPTEANLVHYAILYQRQAGVRPVEFSAQFHLPESARVRWHEASHSASLNPHEFSMLGDLSSDEYYGLVLGP